MCRRILCGLFLCVLGAWGLSACASLEEKEELDGNAPSVVRIHLESSQVRSTVEQSEKNDERINTLDIFVFHGATGKPNAEKLDLYRRFTGEALKNIELRTTVGEKIICAVVNNPVASYPALTQLSDLQAQVSYLKNERLGNFLMYGERRKRLGVSDSLEFIVTRLISRVTVNDVKTRFAGTPYQGMKLSDCRLYLVNASGNRLICSGGTPPAPVVLNQKALKSSDMQSLVQKDLLCDAVPTQIGDEGYTQKHYFYAYANETRDLNLCTKLVLEARLDGEVFYYPILINQEGHGYSAGNRHYGIRKNHTYTYGITILRPGTTDPNEPLVPGSVDVSMSVLKWNILPRFDKSF